MLGFSIFVRSFRSLRCISSELRSFYGELYARQESGRKRVVRYTVVTVHAQSDVIFVREKEKAKEITGMETSLSTRCILATTYAYYYDVCVNCSTHIASIEIFEAQEQL